MEGLLVGALWLLVYLAVLVLVVYVVLWGLEQLGISLPPRVVQILWFIVALIALILLVQLLLGGASVPRPFR